MRYFLILLVLFSTLLAAAPFVGKKKVSLITENGELLHIADIKFKADGDAFSYELTMTEQPFTSQFLSMRPFKCIMGVKQIMCHVPYPYSKSGFVTATDLSSLSYDLLFLHKNPAEYGINLWNGMLYKLSVEAGEITGLVYEVDMNTIASPPEDTDKPFSNDEVFEAGVGNYVYPRLLIQ